MAVRQKLKFHVPGVAQQLFQIQVRSAETALGDQPRPPPFGVYVLRAMHGNHADTAAARGRLDQYRITQFPRRLAHRIKVSAQHRAAGRHRHAQRGHRIARLRLVPQHPDPARRRAHENHARLLHGLGKVSVLGQEAIARMQRVRAGLARNAQQGVTVQIALRGGRGADRHRRVRFTQIRKIAVRLGIHGNRFQAQRAQRPDDTPGNRAPVGNDDSFHIALPMRRHGR
ncbi:hypothetical protein D3C72_1379920 [compost metagenome]